MVYYCIEMIVGAKRGFIAKESKEFLNAWGKSAFFTDFDKAQEVAEKAYFTAKRLYPRTRNVGYRILAQKVLPVRADLVK